MVDGLSTFTVDQVQQASDSSPTHPGRDMLQRPVEAHAAPYGLEDRLAIGPQHTDGAVLAIAAHRECGTDEASRGACVAA